MWWTESRYLHQKTQKKVDHFGKIACQISFRVYANKTELITRKVNQGHPINKVKNSRNCLTYNSGQPQTNKTWLHNCRQEERWKTKWYVTGGNSIGKVWHGAKPSTKSKEHREVKEDGGKHERHKLKNGRRERWTGKCTYNFRCIELAIKLQFLESSYWNTT